MIAKNLLLLVCCSLLVLTGCGSPVPNSPEETKKSKSNQPNKDIAESSKPKGRKQQTKNASSPEKPTTKIVKKSFSTGNSRGGGFAAKSSRNTNRRVNLTRAILEYGQESNQSTPTELIWLIDRTTSATSLRDQVISELKEQASTFMGSEKLAMAAVGYGSEADGLTAKSTKSPEEFVATLSEVSKEKPDQTEDHTISSLLNAANRVDSTGSNERKRSILVLVTDGAGVSENQAIEEPTQRLIKILKSKSSPLFVIGNAAPFGRQSDLVEGKLNTIYGPETAFSERINLEMWNGSTDLFRLDSGFGPWNLERICRETAGRFLANRPAGKSMRIISKMNSNWPASTSSQFSDSAMASYKPFYGSREDYLADVNANKAKLALHNAAKLPLTKSFRNQVYEFRQGNEAALARQINMTQRIPAVIRPGIEKMYLTLKPGESERDLLRNKRWQASFDLAYGRTMANYVRVIGLNSMLAELKGGKTFQNKDNNTWILRSGEAISTGTSNKKMADKARLFLNRVIEQHPDTPWAAIAEVELESPMGWEWVEEKR